MAEDEYTALDALSERRDRIDLSSAAFRQSLQSFSARIKRAARLIVPPQPEPLRLPSSGRDDVLMQRHRPIGRDVESRIEPARELLRVAESRRHADNLRSL